jgi:hypothetical protein
MGYARVFWIREEPVRQYIAARGLCDALANEVGRQVLSLSVKDNFREHDAAREALPLFDAPSVFFRFRSFHSTDFSILLWTGSRLCHLPEASPAMFDALCELTVTVGTSHVVLPVSRAEYHRVIGGGTWQNSIESEAHSSLYFIYEDFTCELAHREESEWPCKDVGDATLKLMLSRWSRSESIGRHGNAITRCCSLSRPELAVAVWWRNSLRLVSDVNANELEEMREYLARE